MGLNDLPNEVIVKIFRYLSIEDLGNWTKVSKRFRNVCLDKALPYGKMKNVFRKDMSQKDLEDSLAKKIKMIKILKIEELKQKLQQKKTRYLQKQQGQLGPADQLGQAGGANQSTPTVQEFLKDDPILMESYMKHWKQQQRQGQPRPAGQSGHDSGANQPKPIMHQGLLKLVATLKNPYLKNTHQETWLQQHKIMQRQQQIIHQHMASLSDQDRQKFTQMSSGEKHQYLAQRNLLITSNMQMQHTTIGKNLLFLFFPVVF